MVRCGHLLVVVSATAFSSGCSSRATPVVSEDGGSAADAPSDARSDAGADAAEQDSSSSDAGWGSEDGDRDSEAPDVANLSCPADMALVPHTRLCWDRYEASRGPEDQAVSVAGVLPWVSVELHEAHSACRLAGKRLCSAEEWMASCAGPLELSFPYGDVFDEERCNGPSQGGVLRPTGDFPGCEGPVPGLYDLSGNASEWSSTLFENVQYHVGGSYETPEWHLRCRSFNSVGQGYVMHDLGFRCCADPTSD